MRTLDARATTVPAYFNQDLFYCASLPAGYADDLSRRWPLIVFLHGIGERGDTIDSLPAVLGLGLGSLVASRHPLEFGGESFVVLIPQLRSGSSEWHPYIVDAMVEHGLQDFRTDPRRVYITGLSLGAFGTDRYVEATDAFAQKVAAVAPTDGMNSGTSIYTPGVPNDSLVLDFCRPSRFNVPVWVFVGANDSSWGWTVNNGLAAMNACVPPPNPAPMLTTYPGVGHGGWTLTYTTDHSVHDPNVYEWLLAHQRP
jgi:predicted peptidase